MMARNEMTSLERLDRRTVLCAPIYIDRKNPIMREDPKGNVQHELVDSSVYGKEGMFVGGLD